MTVLPAPTDDELKLRKLAAAEEKDTAYAKCIYDLRDLASQTGCTFLVLHHTNKSGGSRGTTAFEDNVSEVWFLTHEVMDGYTPQHRKLRIMKSRSGCTGSHKLLLDVDDYSWRVEEEEDDESSEVKPLQQRVLEYLQQSPGVWFEPDELTYVFPECKSRDAIRKHLERLRKKGLLNAEDRVKSYSNPDSTHPDRVSSNRYKVYCYAQSINSSYMSQTAKNPNASINESSDVQLTNICPQSQSDYLDKPKTINNHVQLTKPNPRGNPDYLDTDRCGNRETKENPQNVDIKNTYTSTLAVGDRVRYVGQEYWRICGGRVLTVKAIVGELAIVSFPSWVIDNKFPLQDLQKISGVA